MMKAAIGIFDTLPAVERALVDLAASDLPSQAYSVATHVARYAPNDHQNQITLLALRQSFPDVHILPLPAGNALMISGVLASSLRASLADAIPPDIASLIGSLLIRFGVTPDDAQPVDAQLRAGAILLMVVASERQYPQITPILDRHARSNAVQQVGEHGTTVWQNTSTPGWNIQFPPDSDK